MVEMNLQGEVSKINNLDSKGKDTEKHTKFIKINQENGCKMSIEVEPREGMGLKPGDHVKIQLTTPQQTVTEAMKEKKK